MPFRTGSRRVSFDGQQTQASKPPIRLIDASPAVPSSGNSIASDEPVGAEEAGIGGAPANVMAGLARKSSAAQRFANRRGSFIGGAAGMGGGGGGGASSVGSGSSWMSGQLSRAVMQHSHAGKEAVSFLKVAWYLTLCCIIGLGIAGIVVQRQLGHNLADIAHLMLLQAEQAVSF